MTCPASKVNLVGDIIDIAVNTTPRYNAFPHAVAIRPDLWLLVYRKGLDPYGDAGNIVKRTSTNEGFAWSTEVAILGDNATFDPPEAMLTVLSDGRIGLVYWRGTVPGGTMNQGCWAMFSSDNGATWGAEIHILDSLYWSAVTGPIVELANGDLLVALYGPVAYGAFTSARVMRSTDGGATWANYSSVAMDNHVEEPNLLLMANGDVGMFIRWNSLRVYLATSTDGGATWGTPVYLFPGSTAPRCIRDGTDLYFGDRGETFADISMRLRRYTDGAWHDLTQMDPDFGLGNNCAILPSSGGTFTYIFASEPGGGQSSVRQRRFAPCSDSPAPAASSPAAALL